MINIRTRPKIFWPEAQWVLSIKCEVVLVWWMAAGDWWRGRCLTTLLWPPRDCSGLHSSPSTPHCSNHHHITSLSGQDVSTRRVKTFYIYSTNLNRNLHHKSHLFSPAASLFTLFVAVKTALSVKAGVYITISPNQSVWTFNVVEIGELNRL